MKTTKGKILVTGGLGYIGSHTAVELLSQGFEVVLLDDLSNSKAFVKDRISAITQKSPDFVQVDLKDKEALYDALSQYAGKIEGVIHFAAHKAVGESVENPLKYYKNNLLSLIHVLEWMKEFSVGSLIFSSSCTVYGQGDTMPLTEDSPLKPCESPYGNTKKMCEEILVDFAKINSQKCTLLRYFNPIGAHPSGLLGELPLGVPNNLVPYVSQTAAGIREVLKIFGNDYPTPDGTAIRDYIDVVDLAFAHVLCLKKLLEKSSVEDSSRVEIYNLGTGSGSSVLEVVQTFEKAAQTKVNYIFAPRREGDIVCAYADNQKAKIELGWQPKTSLLESLQNVWRWQQSLGED
ncbi:MAG: UDP-glucose 4-epimerase GalE [Flavobacteriaceae bacterium]|nr:MAG: UDP-glucose 4-epimerase GalE [Flavobacteriaceae bacterium]